MQTTTGSGPFSKPTGLPSDIDNFLKRKTVNAYYNQTPEADSTANSAYTSENAGSPKLKNVLKSTEIQNPNGTPVSRSEFIYDDPNNKGNLIETRTWDSTKQPILQGADSNGFKLVNNNFVKTTMTYDTYGNPLTVIDAKGNQTKLTYGLVGSFTDLYPTQTETAYGTAIKRTATAVYDFYTGIVTSATDVDNNLTNATVYDDLGRPLISKTAVNTPLEVWSKTEYDDVYRRVIVRSDLEVKNDGKKVAVQHYDELGRVRLSRSIENAATENPYNERHGIKVQTRYQTGTPNSYQVTSNPYRAETSGAATNEPSMGWTRSKSINTGKYSEMETFTGATLPYPFLTSGYNTNSTGKVRTDLYTDRVLVTDQAGKQRISKTNALGQLTDIWEITASDASTVAVSFPNYSGITHGYQTSYQYDTLNNLTTVNQGSQTRTFSYSSLSRVLSANNPESGTISYLYDNNGNLTQKTDARGIETDYSYDALNRVTSRDYSDSTPDVSYIYNTKGQLTKAENDYSKTEYTQFDILGRVTKSKQTTDGTAYNEMEYVYNLSGGLVEQKYPSGRVVKNVLDDDGMLSIVQSKKNETAGYWDYAKNFTFTAAGAVSSMQLGNGKWESTVFNSRLQPTTIALGTVQGGTDKLNLVYNYGTTNNNGNVLSQTITVPTVGSNQGFTAVQTYTYDSLNRIKSTVENITPVGGTASQSWKQTFTYDRYGNRNFDEAETTTLPKNCTESSNPAVCAADRKVVNPEILTSNNRLKTDQDGDSQDDYLFDTSGNTTKDANGRIFIYDAENKQIQVKDSSSNNIGEYFYDGDGRRVKKVEFDQYGTPTQTTNQVRQSNGV